VAEGHPDCRIGPVAVGPPVRERPRHVRERRQLLGCRAAPRVPDASYSAHDRVP
jgi:hypothetical protein